VSRVPRPAALCALAVLVCALAPSGARAGGPALVIGGAEDFVRQDSVPAAKAQLDLLRLAGLRAVRVTSIWRPGLREPDEGESRALAAVAGAAELTATRVFVAVYHAGSRTTPLSPEDQADFASYVAAIARQQPFVTDFVIGNEPNLNRFWLPQYDAEGRAVAAASYVSLLARSYDALKAVNPEITVIGGAVSPRGGDRPDGIRPTRSPTEFIRDMGVAYRGSGRTSPLMDAFAIHPYGENSSIPPTFAHPETTSIGIADYDKLVSLLGEAFDGTAQPGSVLPIFYTEFGVETRIPEEKASLYTGAELASVKPVDEGTQGVFYRQAFRLAFCQPNVRGIFVFHAIDERDLDRWQSGLYYPDATPKSSVDAVTDAARDVRGAVIARCAGLELTPQVQVGYPGAALLAAGSPLTVRLTCDIDCAYYVRLERLPRGSTTAARRGRAFATERTVVTLPPTGH